MFEWTVFRISNTVFEVLTQTCLKLSNSFASLFLRKPRRGPLRAARIVLNEYTTCVNVSTIERSVVRKKHIDTKRDLTAHIDVEFD